MKLKVDIKCYIYQQDWESLPRFGYFFGTFAHFKELRESSNLSVQKTCFCCGHKFQPEDFISLACFDKGLGNKFLCQKCKDIALKDLGDKNIYLH